MFGFFSKKQPECPIDTDTRLWMEQAFAWLVIEFGENNIKSKPLLLPTAEYFPIQYDGSPESLSQTAAIIAHQLDVNPNEINIDFYNQSIQEFKSDFGFRTFTVPDENSEVVMAAGMYFNKNETGKYDIFIEKNLLQDPEKLVATLSHEFAHIKLLGEKRVHFNDESLTDLATVVFGIGIFNARCAFREIKTFDVRGHDSLGYLKQREWGYALALYAWYRQEIDPVWINHLTPNIKSDFKKSSAFIHANTDKIFKEKYNPRRNA